MKKVSVYTLLFSTLFLFGCDWFNYHPYDGRIKGERKINDKNIAVIEEKMEGKNSFKFAFISDTQGWFGDMLDAVNDINSRGDIDFVLHGGDISDYGLTKEFLWQRDIMNKLRMPYVVLIGNHDILANGEEVFVKVFGDVNFSFVAGDVKFVCLNTNALEHDYSRPVPDFQFLKRENNPEDERHKRTIVAMHARPYSEQFNNNVADVFQYEINRYPNLMFCLNGHDHQLTATDIFEDGIIYYGTPNIHKRKYLIFTVTKDASDYEVVDF